MKFTFPGTMIGAVGEGVGERVDVVVVWEVDATVVVVVVVVGTTEELEELA